MNVWTCACDADQLCRSVDKQLPAAALLIKYTAQLHDLSNSVVASVGQSTPLQLQAANVKAASSPHHNSSPHHHHTVMCWQPGQHTHDIDTVCGAYATALQAAASPVTAPQSPKMSTPPPAGGACHTFAPSPIHHTNLSLHIQRRQMHSSRSRMCLLTTIPL